MKNVNLVPTAEELVSENYPYGYTLKTTKTYRIEFKKGRGFRHVSQTVNPKTGRLNAPKAGTYYDAMVLGRNPENGHVFSHCCDFNGVERINSNCKFMSDHFELFAPAEINYIYSTVVSMLIVSVKAQVIYCGSKQADVLPIFEDAIKTAKEGATTGANVFDRISLDTAAIEATKTPGYNPFTIREMTEYNTI